MDNLNLPWKFKHTDMLSDHGDIVDSQGNEICTVYGIFGNGKAPYIEYLLKSVNPPEVEVKEAL